MITSSEQFMEIREQEVGIPMFMSPPKSTVDDYSLNEFEQLTRHHSRLNNEEKAIILNAINDYKKIINNF